MLQKHPEVDQSQPMIGWQPVHSIQQNQQARSSFNTFVLGVAVAVTLACVATSGGLLWSRATKTEAEVNAEIQQALIIERERIQTCIATNQGLSSPQTPSRVIRR